MNLHLAVRIFTIVLAILTFESPADAQQNLKKSVSIGGQKTIETSEKDRQNRQLCSTVGQNALADIDEFQHIEAAGVRWMVVFEDFLVPKFLKKEIMEDIALIISRYSKYDLVEPRYDKTFNIGGCETLSISYLGFSVSRSSYVPESFRRKGLSLRVRRHKIWGDIRRQIA